MFRLHAAARALVFEQVAARLALGPLRISVPGLRIEGRAEGIGEHAEIDVRLYAPLVGLVLRYTGTVNVRGTE